MLRISTAEAGTSKEGKSRPGVPDGSKLEVYFSTGFLHLLLTVHAKDIDIFCGPDGLTTARANILSGAAGLFQFRVCSAELTGTGNCQLVTPFLGGAEAFQIRAGLGDGKTYFLVIVNKQTPLLCLFLEALVMIGVPTAGILNIVQLAVVMDHLMNEGSNGIRYRPIQSLSTDIDFVIGSLALGILPDLICGKVPIGTGAGLNGNDGLWKYIFKVFLVQSVERIFKKFGCLADGHG